MSVTSRYAGPMDVRHNVKFCLIRVEIDSDRFTVTVSHDLKLRQDSIDKSYCYFGPLGNASNVALGELRLSSSTAYSYVGHVIDYDVNCEDALKTATEAGQRVFDMMMHQLDVRLSRMQSVELKVIEA